MERDNYKWCLHTRACVMGAVRVCACVGEYVRMSLHSSQRPGKEGNPQSNFRTEALVCLHCWTTVEPWL